MSGSVLCIKETVLNQNHHDLKNEDFLEFKDKELTFRVYKSIKDCEEYWSALRCEDPFYSPEYFQLLESDLLKGAKPMYAFAFVADEPEPIASYHLHKKKLRLIESIDIEKFKESGNLWAKIKYQLQRLFFPLVYFNMMVVGNLLLTGKYGFRGTNGTIQKIDYDILKRLLENLKCNVAGTEYKFRGALIKDFVEKERLEESSKHGLGELQVDPSMVMPIRKDWNNMDDYLLDMKSKHRVRTKKHLKNATDIEFRSLTIEETEGLENEMFTLYDSVVSASGFKMVSVRKGYFTKMLKAFPNQFHIEGMFNEGNLIGFFTYMLKEGDILSHFIGYKEQDNRQYSIYMNILLGLIKISIELNANNLYYYRTALEIKSSVGAEPQNMYCYLMHNNTLINKTINIIIKTFFPVPVWIQRRPFKEYRLQL